MRIAKVVGKVVLNRCHPSFDNATLKLVVPLEFPDLAGNEPVGAETLVAWDQMATGPDSLIALSEGPEAAQPFRPEVKPVDAYVAAILDDLDLEPSLLIRIVGEDRK